MLLSAPSRPGPARVFSCGPHRSAPRAGPAAALRRWPSLTRRWASSSRATRPPEPPCRCPSRLRRNGTQVSAVRCTHFSGNRCKMKVQEEHIKQGAQTPPATTPF